MMAKFLTPKPLMRMDNPKIWELREPLLYFSDVVGRVVEVPTRFKTDLESMTRWLPILYAWLASVANLAAIVHDWLYYSAVTDRETADLILLEAMVVSKVNGVKRQLIYWGVRIGGWKAWNDHRKAGHSLTEFNRRNRP